MPSNALGTYLSKFDDWKFCPPSDHLWTVSFSLATQGTAITDNSLGALYKNILEVNNRHDSIFGTKWKVDAPEDEARNFITSSQDSSIGSFLATDISFETNDVIIQHDPGTVLTQFSGWVSYGKFQSGRNHSHNIKISFNKTNWDINELFFDRWIAAIGQQGLIEDSRLKNIKANIVIREYACSSPNNAGAWVPRKQILLTRAFPKSRKDYEYSYRYDTAGAMKTDMVEFEFDNYQILYQGLNAYTDKSGGTPGYISPTFSEGYSEVTGDYITKEEVQGALGNLK